MHREIEDAPRRPGIPVARLPDGTGIHEESGPEAVDHREVRVAQDDERRAGRADDRFVCGPGEDVLVVVPRTPMVHRHDAFGHRAARPVLEVFQIADTRGGEMDPRPPDALGCELVEPRRVAADRPAVVVPPNRSDMSRAQDLKHLVRPRVVADEVARHPDSVGGDAVDVREDGLERGEIRVDIGEDRETHPATERSRSISGSQYGARRRRQSGHRDEANELIRRSWWPIGVPGGPKKFLDGYHWMPEASSSRRGAILHPLPAPGTLGVPQSAGRCAMRT